MAKVGRPTIMTTQTISKLEEAFQMGCSDIEACLHSGIDRRTLYKYQEEHPGFIQRKEELKQNPSLMARRNLRNLLKSEDKTATLFYLERKLKHEFSTKTEIDQDVNITIEITNYGSGGKPQQIENNQVKAIDAPVDNFIEIETTKDNQ